MKQDEKEQTKGNFYEKRNCRSRKERNGQKKKGRRLTEHPKQVLDSTIPIHLEKFSSCTSQERPEREIMLRACFPSPSTCCMIFRTSHGRFAADTNPAFVDNLISISIRAFFVRAERVSASCEKQQIEMKAKKCRERSQWVYLSS